MSILAKEKCFDAIAIAYSPIHVLILAKLFEGNTSFLIIADKSLRGICNILFPGNHHIFTALPSFNVSGKSKLVAIGDCLRLRTMSIKCNSLYIPNEAHFFVALLESLIQYSVIFYIDEGNTYSSLIRHYRNPDYYRSTLSRIVSILLRIPYYKHPLSRRDFSAAYVFNAPAVRSLVPGLKIRDASLPSLDIITSLFSSTIDDTFLNSEVAFFFSSPITENGFSTYPWEELDALNAFLRKEFSATNTTLYIKPHYRESIDKYHATVSSYSNVKMLPDYFLSLPSQILVTLVKPRLVVGFHSSSILGFEEPIRVISLSRQLKSPKAQALHLSLMNLVQEKSNYRFF